jgi:hypothetical protein
MFAFMNRFLSLLLCFLAARAISVHAADPLTDAAALATRQDAEERYKRLAADVQAILDTQEVLQKRQEDLRQRLDKLVEEIRSLKEDQSRSGSLATREELRKYVEKLKEVDEKREMDKKVILENIKELAKAPPVVVAESKPPKSRSAEPAEEQPFVYVVKKNDRLLDIVAEYNDYFQKRGQSKITMDQVLKANPGLKADRLVAGKKIRIPAGGKESK